MMINFINSSLTRKLIALVLGVSLISVAIVGYLSYASGKATIKRQFYDSLTSIVKSREAAVAFYLRSKTGRVRDFSSDGFIRKTLEKLNQETSAVKPLLEELNRHLLENKKSLDPEIYEIYVLDFHGKVVASSEQETIGTNRSGEAYFTKGKKGIYVTDTYRSVTKNKDLITVSAPIWSGEAKEVIGVIVCCYNLEGLNSITTNREGMGESGEVYVVNRDRYIITEPRFIKEAIRKQKVDTMPVSLFQEQKTDMRGIYPDYRGVPIVGASAGGIIDQEFGLGWTVLAEIDVGEALAPLKVLAWRVVWIGLFVGFVVMIITYIASKKNSKTHKGNIRTGYEDWRR